MRGLIKNINDSVDEVGKKNQRKGGPQLNASI